MMNIKITATILFISLVLTTEQGFSQSFRLRSPDKQVVAIFNTGDAEASLVTYNLSYAGEPVLTKAKIGFDVKDVSSADFLLRKSKRKSVSKRWQPVYGERKSIPDKYNQLVFHFRNRNDKSLTLQVTCRAYNEGFAFKYELINPGKTFVLTKESSTFPLPAKATAWVSTTAQGVITEKKINDINAAVDRPVVADLHDNRFLAIGEAALVDYARMKFKSQGDNSLISVLDGEVIATDTLSSPWRYVMTAASPAELLEENYMVLNLNAPNAIKNTEWIKPGKIIREVTLNTAGAFRCIDFASTHNISYILFDAGWYGREDHDTSNATRVSLDPARAKGSLDLKQVIAYGKEKNIGVMLYVNRRALERQIDTLLPLYQSWGIKGIKFGFVLVGSQKVTSWLHEAVRKAAQHNMLVDIHDEYRPTGYSRTYPNLLTQEGIRGDEESPDITHSITTIFTRMIAGAADNTICYFTNRVDKMGSHTAQMAKALCLYSPLQFLYWYDRPLPDSAKKGGEGEIKETPELAWFNVLPVVWDDTKVLEADMRQYATIARKSKDDWFIGSLNGEQARTVSWPCTFLDKNKKYRAVIYSDDESVNTSTRVKIASMPVNHQTIISLPVVAKKGIAVHITVE